MSLCPKCGVEVREGKAFCYNCGEPMSRGAASRGEKPPPELFEDTVLDPPSRRPERQQDAPQQQTPTTRAAAPAHAPPRRPATEGKAAPPRQPRTAPAAFEQPGTAKGRRRKFFYGKFGIGAVVLLLLLVVLGVLAVAVLSG